MKLRYICEFVHKVMWKKLDFSLNEWKINVILHYMCEFTFYPCYYIDIFVFKNTGNYVKVQKLNFDFIARFLFY